MNPQFRFRDLALLSMAAFILIRGGEAGAAQAKSATAKHASEEPAAPDYAARRNARIASFFKRVDKDGDGFVSRAEAEAFVGARFDRLDAKHKGYLTLEDYESSLQRGIDRAAERGDDDRRERLESVLPHLEDEFKAMNKSGNGHVTKDEFLADSHARFEESDGNKDGKLSLEEMQAVPGHAF